MRIEFTERFIDMTEDELDSASNLGTAIKYNYRRISVRIEEVFCAKEIPGKKTHCEIEFNDGSIIVIKANFDDITIKLNDLENSMYEIGEDE